MLRSLFANRSTQVQDGQRWREADEQQTTLPHQQIMDPVMNLAAYHF
jgi:hypothetical protein